MIETAQLKSAFDTYISNTKKEILRRLLAAEETAKYMTTLPKTITEYRAAKAAITSVVQGFQANWTPSGDVEFTPITITNRQHKINVEIIPDEVKDSWLGYLNDESKLPKDMPITKYIIEKLILPQVIHDREMFIIGKGVYAAPVNGTPQAVGKSADGYLTILKKEALDNKSKISFIHTEALTSTNVVDEVEKFVDSIDLLYQSISMPVFCSPQVFKMYQRRYRELYPATKNEDKNNVQIDFSANKLVPLQSMTGSKILFVTPKTNFIRLINMNKGASRIWMQEFDYSVKVFADWWEAPGFAIAEAVFASVPEGNAITEIAADATTFDSSAGLRFFRTGDNTSAKAIATISGSVADQVIYIIGGEAANGFPTTIANAGNFTLNSDWEAEEGAVLRLLADGTGKFTELGRSN